VEVLLTRALLESAGGRLEEAVFSVRAANRKAARRTGDAANAFKASVEVRGDDFACRPLLTVNPPQPGSEPLVRPEHPIPLCRFSNSPDSASGLCGRFGRASSTGHAGRWPRVWATVSRRR
jgi:hypothetical protein